MVRGPQILIGVVSPDIQARISEQLSKLGTYIGSWSTIIADAPDDAVNSDAGVAVHITVDYYVSHGVTHVVVGALSGDGTYWEILSDTAIPTVPPHA
jgi:hypothetical protein